MRKATRKLSDSKKAIGYIRVSTEDQNLGPEAQRESLKKFCKLNGIELIAVYTDHGVSGGAELDKRPALMEAIDALADKGAGILLVAKRDRLARDTMYAAMIERLAERNGAKVQSADGVGNGDSPESILMKNIIDCFAQYERAIIKARTKEALGVKKGKGERVGQIPYGWMLSDDGIHLTPHIAEQEIIKAARKLREEGMTFQSIGDTLAKRGMFPREGKSFWYPQTVSNLLKAEIV
jgi:DNA invertase Pin-like site-specific DNA recombinase